MCDEMSLLPCGSRIFLHSFLAFYCKHHAVHIKKKQSNETMSYFVVCYLTLLQENSVSTLKRVIYGTDICDVFGDSNATL